MIVFTRAERGTFEQCLVGASPAARAAQRRMSS